MKVQRIVIPGREVVSWILLDDSYVPVKPVLEFLDYQRCLQRSPYTIRALAFRLKLFWEFMQGADITWNEISPQHLAQFIEWMRWPISIRGEAKITPSHSAVSINVTLNAVSSFYKYHSRFNEYSSMPFTHRRVRRVPGEGYQPFLAHLRRSRHTWTVVERLRTVVETPKTLTAAEMQLLREACHLKRDKFLTALLGETGMRIGQALGLRHEDIVSWDNKILVKARDDNVNGARAKMSIGSQNIIFVDEALMGLYIDYLTSELENIESDYVFVTLRGPNVGRPLQYHAVTSLFRRLEIRTGVHATPHLYRHTHATELFEEYNWDVSLVQRRLGHSSPQTTAQIYIHSSQKALKEAHGKLIDKKGGKS